jgi:hypothetical protein
VIGNVACNAGKGCCCVGVEAFARPCDDGRVGVLVTFESRRLLLQREDFPAALRALKKRAKENPDSFHDAEAVTRTRDLASALQAADFAATFDEHGDLRGLSYVGEKLPRGADDDFPRFLLDAWKKLLHDSRFDRWIEGTIMRHFSVSRGKVRAQDWTPPQRRLEQVGAPSRCRPGESIDVSFRYVSTIADDDVVCETVRDPKAWVSSGALVVEYDLRKMRPSDVTTVRAHLREDASQYEWDESCTISGSANGASMTGWITVLADTGDDLDDAPSIVATESSFRGAFSSGRAAEAALEDMKRYAVRHATEPGGAFLAQVAAAGDIATALQAAGFAADPEKLAFSADRLPGSERHVLDLLRSFAAVTDADGEVRLAYASSPQWWTSFDYRKGVLRRLRHRRG